MMKDKKANMKTKGLEIYYGLAFQCPYNNRQEDCPLIKVDGMTFREKIEWINGANPTLLKTIGIAHKTCFNKSK